MATNVHTHSYDAIVVGAGGAGLMAALYAGREPDLRTAVISKLYPTRSHTGAAQGGIGAALGNMDEDGDRPEWHAFDTVKGSDYLGDQDAIRVMCEAAPEIVYELEHMGLPFSRTEDGRIAQRRFGGHTKNFGEEAVRRSCYAASRTGHTILQTLYQQCSKEGVEFHNEYHVLDLLMEDGTCRGVVALELATGDLHVFRAKGVLMATGGHGRVWEVTSNAVTLTGDGLTLASRAGIPMEDLEFYQFHPTGIAGMGILITEGVRGEGGVLRNDAGERFMEEYAPNMKDLASRDVVSRAMYKEIRAGRGIDGERKLYLDATHLGRDVLEEKLTEIVDFCRTYLGIDPIEDPMPVHPTAHYAMGGIPTNVDGEVLASEEEDDVVPGLYAAGETACVSIHGANRLGTNALLELVVFGKRAGTAMSEYCRGSDLPSPPPEAAEPARADLEAIRSRSDGERAAEIRAELQRLMMDNVSVFRTEELLEEARDRLRELGERAERIAIDDKGEAFNLDLTEAWETRGMVELAQVITECALNRTESRGAHSREDYPERDDDRWLKHTFAFRRDGDIEIRYQPVTVTEFEPKERTY